MIWWCLLNYLDKVFYLNLFWNTNRHYLSQLRYLDILLAKLSNLTTGVYNFIPIKNLQTTATTYHSKYKFLLFTLNNEFMATSILRIIFLQTTDIMSFEIQVSILYFEKIFFYYFIFSCPSFFCLIFYPQKHQEDNY